VANFFGIYRGVVTGAVDPQGRRRLRVQLPSLLEGDDVWAEPCVPTRSRASPALGSVVWVMFEGGDIKFPVWVGVGTFPTP
jgi:hypothetical protein